MKIAPTTDVPTYPEPQLFERVLPLDGASIVELGCGRAQLTRLIASAGSARRVLALEEVKRRFARHVTAEGVRFAQPIRVDLLRRPH